MTGRMIAPAPLLALTPLLALALLGCPKRGGEGSKHRTDAVAIFEVKVDDRTPGRLRPPDLSEAQLTEHVREKLGASRWVELVGKRVEGAYRFKLELGIGQRDDPGEKVVLVSARASDPDALDGVVLQASVVAPAPKGSPSDLRNKVMAVVGSVLDDIVFQASLARGDPARVVKALELKDASRLGAVVEIAAVRRVKGAVPGLIRLLRHKDETVADRSIGALVAIGDRRAVKPLTRLTKFSDTEKMAKIIDGIGALGGKEATDYLEFVSSGHEDADIRNLAAEALARMRKNPKKAPGKQ